MRLDLFCTVVDNFGDIGVTWRLARQLRLEHGAQVRVWVDDLATFARLEPSVDVVASVQTVQGVEIEHWRAERVIGKAFEDGWLDPFWHQAGLGALRMRWVNQTRDL